MTLSEDQLIEKNGKCMDIVQEILSCHTNMNLFVLNVDIT